MTQPMPFWEWLFRYLALAVEPYRPPPPPRSAGRLEPIHEDLPMHLKYTPPTSQGAATFDLHYTPSGSTETTLNVPPSGATFEVTSAGPLEFFCVAVSDKGVRSDPSPKDTFEVKDTVGGEKPPTPTSAGTMEQVD